MRLVLRRRLRQTFEECGSHIGALCHSRGGLPATARLVTVFGFQASSPPQQQNEALMEMHRMFELDVKDLCVNLWPVEPIPDT